MGPPASHQVSRAWWYSGATLWLVHFAYGAFTLYGRPLQIASTIDASRYEWSTTPDKSGLGSSPFARRYLGNRCFFLFLRVLRCFSSPGYLLCTYEFSTGYLRITVSEFPHSEICGLTDVCSCPQLIAACHVLLRLLVPRHSPYALLHLTKSELLPALGNYFFTLLINSVIFLVSR